MTPRTLRFFNPDGPQRVATISVEPASTDEVLVRLSRGATARQLNTVETSGPLAEEQLPDCVAEMEQALRADGYLPAGVPALLEALQSADSAIRARAALRLGWMRSRDAVDALLAAASNAVDDICSILDALGAIGDAQATPLSRQHAARKLLSRRRSAVEALRNLHDAEGLAAAEKLALERLPESIRHQTGETDTLIAALKALDVQQRGLALDTLYELATPTAVAAVRAVLRETPIDRPHLWRYVKSIVKRACLRHDHATFGELMHQIEVQGRTSSGTTASIKSGYDGQQRSTRIFGRKAQLYVRRAAWRYLRNLAKHRPEEYPFAAAEVLIHYTPEDAQEPKGLYGAFTYCYLLHRILWGGSQRFRFDDRRLRFRFRSAQQVKAPAAAREEAYPALWDAQPRAYVRVLGAAKLVEAHVFALRPFAKPRPRGSDLRDALTEASTAEVIALLGAPHPPTVLVGIAELERRFDPLNPDWKLLQALFGAHPHARLLGLQLIRETGPLWTRDADLILDFLAPTFADARPLVLEVARAGLHDNPLLRKTLAQRILAILRTPEPAPGAHEGYAVFARAVLAAELNALLSVSEIADLVFRGSPSAQAVAAELLRHRPEAVTELGLERLTVMAQHDMAVVRAAVHGLIRSAEESLRNDPAPLFVLVESDWADTRAVAFDLLRRVIDPEKLGLDGLLGLLDSNRIDVQDFGQELTRKHFAHVPADELVLRLVQHPHPHMRGFALELAVQHLPDGAAPLGRMRQFFRASVFDLWPERKIKRQVIDLLLERGLRDEEQAQVAADILGDVVRLHGRADFERGLEALVRLKLAYPDIETAIHLQEGGVV